MSILVFVENADGQVKKTSLEAVAYAAAISEDVIALAMGNNIDQSELEGLGKYGATKVLHADDEKLNQGIIQAYATVISKAMESTGADILVLANSSLGAPVSARVAIKTDASLVSNVVDLPDTSAGFKVKRSIYTGKAFANVELTKDKKILAIKKNAAEVKEADGSAAVEKFAADLADSEFDAKITNTDKATGEVLLPEAEIVVSGGRGLKGPENWGMIEELAKELGAATGCSKPVSDMEWRPHHEHVGQTGVKVSPQLYIAIGISGAIQHLAGVNSSKNIVVINKDPEAPFFKAADYGIVGDAFEVVPKLTEAIRAAK
ncbi:electron transfer flavoprotein subunit alpha/FixB family protein [Fulvivirga sediminis]|uniref:Electron transfer flavoprotein subunit alpha/FixB family protein n=1 Tax=Fulvivirga sediminis TaxID=2803949 RepID=A0A937F7Z8_9BACT|nr:electron transfer flavoprotein subunit alpha/FixB family protein [Fulvivirga sediminis]MBL3655668.1 electron transfer flavoprotein subunit alpha/FixB family protein [Fulvivirga sediminis]